MPLVGAMEMNLRLVMKNFFTSKYNLFTRIFVVLSTLFIASCGGGGGDSEDEQTIGTYEIRIMQNAANVVDGKPVLRISESYQLGIFDVETGIQDRGVYVDESNQNFELNQYKWTVSSDENAGVETVEGFTTKLVGRSLGTITISAVNRRNSLSKEIVILDALLQSSDISVDELSIYKGLTYQFSATGNYSDQSTRNLTEGVTWTSSAPAIGSIDTNGLFTANAVGETLITVSKNDEFGTPISDTITVTVTPAAIERLNINESLEMIHGRSQTLAVNATFTDGTTQVLSDNLTWEITDTNVFNADAQANVSAVNQGSTSAIVQADNGYGTTINSNATAITVTERVLDSVVITPNDQRFDQTSPVIAIERQEEFNVEGIYSTQERESIIRLDTLNVTSSAPDIANIALNSEDKYIVSTLAEGQTTIDAAITNRLGQEITTQLPLRVNRPLLISLAISVNNLSLPVGLTANWSAIGTLEDGTTKDFTSQVAWKSDSEDNASFKSSDTVQQITANKIGSANISASFVNDIDVNIISNVVAVSIIPPQVQYVQVESVSEGILADSKFSIAQGITHQLQLVGIYSDGSREVASNVNWTSSDVTMATISGANGLLDAGKTSDKTGDITISGSTGDFENRQFSGDLALSVTPALLQSMSLEVVTDDGLWKGFVLRIDAKGQFSDDVERDINSQLNWSVDSGSTALIEQLTTLANGFKLLDEGTAKVNAEFVDPYNKNTITNSNIEFTIKPALITSIEIEARDNFGQTISEIASGKAFRFVATATYSDQTSQDVSQLVNWGASPSGFLNIENSGSDKGKTDTLAQTHNDTNLTASASLINTGNHTISDQLGFTILPAALETLALLPVDNYFCSGLSNDATPSCSEVPSGATLQLEVYGNYSDGNQLKITETNFASWSVIDANSNATVDANTGLVTMKAGAEGDVVAIQAQVPLTDIKGTVSLTRSAPVFDTIRIDPDTNSAESWLLNAGEQEEFKAFAQFSDGTEGDVSRLADSWTVPVADQPFVIVDNSPAFMGTVTALDETTSNATVTVTKTNRLGKVVSATGYISVGQPRLSFIEISPLRPTIIAGDSIQYTATGYKTNNESLDLTDLVTWESQRANIADFDDTDKNKLTGVLEGTTSINASYTPPGESNLLIASTQVTVTPKSLRSISIQPMVSRTDSATSKPLFMKGLKDQLAAIGAYSDGSTENISGQVTWQTSASNIATAESGLLDPIAKGEATISIDISYVEAGENKNLDFDYEIVVGDPLLQSIELSPQSSSFVAENGWQQYQALGIFSDQTTTDVTASVTWLAGNESDDSANKVGEFLDATPKGRFTAQKLGSIPVSATIKNFDNEDIIANVQAQVVALTSIIVEKVTTDAIYAGETAQYKVEGVTGAGARVSLNTGVSWTNPDGGYTFKDGDITSNIITIENTLENSSSSPVDITATLAQPVFSYTQSVTINPKLVTSLAMTIDSSTVPNGLTRQLSVTKTFSDNSTESSTSGLTWILSNDSVANVDGSGLISTTDVGSTTISARNVNAKGETVDSNSVPLNVTAAVFTSIDLGVDVSLPLGLGQTFIASGNNSDGTSTANISADQIIWSSDDTDVVVINDEGKITSITQGTATITAQMLDVYKDASRNAVDIQDTAVVTIGAPQLASISATMPASVPRGRSFTVTATGHYTDGSTVSSEVVSWVTSDSNKLELENASDANTKSIEAKGEGTESITLSKGNDFYNNPITFSRPILVTPPVLNSMTLALPASMPLGREQDFVSLLTGLDTTGASVTPSGVTWSSNTANVSIVGSTSLKAQQQGNATIKVTALQTDENGDPITAQDTILVTAPVLESFSAVLYSSDTANKVIPLGRTVTPQLIGVATNGTPISPNGVTWTTSDNEVSISGSTAIKADAIGTGITLTATSTDLDVNNAAITFDLTGVSVGAEVLESMVVDNITSIPLGASRTLGLTTTGSNGTSDGSISAGTVTWSSDSAAVEVNASTGEIEGKLLSQSATITARSNLTDAFGSNIIASRTVNVTAEQLHSLVITADDDVPVGHTGSFIVSGIGTNNSTVPVTGTITWISDTPASLTITDSTTGSFEAKVADSGVGISVSTTTTDFTGAAIVATKNVEVTAAKPASIAFSIPAQIPLGRTINVNVTAFDTAGNSISVGTITWNNEAEFTASGDATSTVKADALGTATLTATSSEKDFKDNFLTSSVNIEVIGAVLESMAIENLPSGNNTPLGQSRVLTVMGTDTNGQPITPNGSVWSTSDRTKVDIINASTGEIKGVASGESATITVTSTDKDADDNFITQSVPLNVVAPVLGSLSIVSQDKDLARGELETFTVQGIDTNGGVALSVGTITWASSDVIKASVVSASPNGHVTAISAGTTNITATSSLQDISNSAIEVSKTVNVIAAIPVGLELHVAGTSRVAEGEKLTITPLDVYSDKSTKFSTRTLDWSSADSSLEFVDGGSTASSLSDIVGPVVVTSISTPPATAVTITALDSDVSPQVNNTIDVMFKSGVTASSVGVTSPRKTVVDNTMEALKAVALYSDNSKRDVSLLSDLSWSVSDATYSSVSNGIATFIDLAVSDATTTFTPTYNGTTGTTGIVTAIEESALNDGTSADQLQAIEIYPKRASVVVNTALDFKVYAIYNYDAVSKYKVVDITDNAGLTITGYDSTATGDVTVTAMFDSKSDTAVVSVEQEITSLSVSTGQTTFNNNTGSLDAKYPVAAIATLTSGATQDVTKLVNWTTSGAAATKISNLTSFNGLLAPTLSTGTATIKAELFTNGIYVSDTQDVTIADSTTRTVTGIDVTVGVASTETASGTITLGNDIRVPFKAEATYSSAPTTVDVTEQVLWSVDGSSAYTSNIRDFSGLLTTAVSVSAGTATVSVRMPGSASDIDQTIELKDTAFDTLEDIEPTTNTINVSDLPRQLSIKIGDGGTVIDSIDVTNQVVWISSDPTVLFVSNAPETKGQITAVAAGSATIKVNYKGQEKSLALTVN